MNALDTLILLAPRRRPLSLSQRKDFDSRWIGELPIVFDGTPAECIAYAEAKGCGWHSDPEMLFGGYFDHPTDCLTLYPT
jgi:hypothetical protein